MSEAANTIDTCVEIVTPESIAFHYRVAGPFRRLPAFLMDVALRVAIFLTAIFSLLLTIGVAGFGDIMGGIILLAWFLLEWFYGAAFETYWNGQTPGKRLMGIRVLTVDGQPIHGVQALLRNVLRSVDLAPLAPLTMSGEVDEMPLYVIPTCLLGAAACLASDRFQRLGDMAAGTMVVVEEPQERVGVTKVAEPEVVRLAAELPANLVVSRGLSRALANYVGRRRTIVGPRRLEIAAPLAEALAIKFDLPRGTNPDHLLCAMYYRVYIADRPQEREVVEAVMV